MNNTGYCQPHAMPDRKIDDVCAAIRLRLSLAIKKAIEERGLTHADAALIARTISDPNLVPTIVELPDTETPNRTIRVLPIRDGDFGENTWVFTPDHFDLSIEGIVIDGVVFKTRTMIPGIVAEFRNKSGDSIGALLIGSRPFQGGFLTRVMFTRRQTP